MKKLILIIALLTVNFGYSQLSEHARFLKKQDFEMYSKMKKFAERDWKGDFKMTTFVINSQVESMFEFNKLCNSTDYDENIMLKAFTEWTENGITDYKMMVYVYKGQLKAKKSL